MADVSIWTTRKFRTYKEAMRAVLPNTTTMKKIADRIKEHCIERLEDDKVTGVPLANSTIDKKIARGANNPFMKLIEGGGLSRQMKTKHDNEHAEIGYYSETHIKFKTYDSSIKVCDLVKIHHEGLNGLPKRTFLEFDNETDEIIEDEIRKRIIGR